MSVDTFYTRKFWGGKVAVLFTNLLNPAAFLSLEKHVQRVVPVTDANVLIYVYLSYIYSFSFGSHFNL